MEKPEKLIGKKLGKYEFVEYLGDKTNARAYKAYQEDENREVIIKLLPVQYPINTAFIEQVKPDTEKLVGLHHPNIVRIYEFQIEAGTPYVVMEYIEGPTLKALLETTRGRHVRIPIELCVLIINNIGSALSYAHNQNITHGCLTPSTILLEKTNRVVVDDFGIAKFMDKEMQHPMGMVKRILSQFSAEQPEITTEDKQKDITALGLIFYELVTSQAVFESAALTPEGYDHLPPPRTVVPEIPEEIESIIQKSMATEPANRYEDVDAMLKELTNLSRKVKTSMLPAARLSDVATMSSRFASAIPPDSDILDSGPMVCLHFLDTGQILNLERQNEYSIGRRYETQPIIPDIDLTPFKAYEWGISRLHAKINVGHAEITITDLGSSNGTYHAGKRIPAEKPYVLRHGDIVYLGKLRIQVLIYG